MMSNGLFYPCLKSLIQVYVVILSLLSNMLDVMDTIVDSIEVMVVEDILVDFTITFVEIVKYRAVVVVELHLRFYEAVHTRVKDKGPKSHTDCRLD